MTNERTIPTPAPSDLPTFGILIEGNEISGAYQVVSIDVRQMFNKIGSARVILLDGDAASEDFQISNSDDFKPGNQIEIQAGYHSDNSTVFKGIIIRHGVKIRKNKPSYLIVEAKDMAVKLTVGRKNAFFYDSSDSEIIEEIAQKAGMQSDVESSSLSHAEMVQHHVTDWDFIVSRAEMNGMLVLTDENKLIVKPPKSDSSPIVSLVHGSTLMEFEAEMDARTQMAAVKSYSWSSADQELVESEASLPSFAENGNISSDDLAEVIGLDEYALTHTGQLSDEELKSWSDARLLRSKIAKIRGRAKFQGLAEAKPGTMIELRGVGERFNGNVFISGIRHQISSENWETDAQFGFPEHWFYENKDVVQAPAAGLVPWVNGLQIGVVAALEEDPDGEDRVQVRVPVINSQDDGLWARVATLDAGENRGSFFRPEIGDEVVLGFLNDDPRDPIILGMLNSSAKPAPLTASDDNHEKGFVTRSEIRMIFNDEKVNLTVETPNGNKIVFSDDEGSVVLTDENSNSITMNSDGISIESQSDINIKASGDLNLEGTNTSIKASAQYKAEGSAGAEMSTGATAILKGSLVQIN